jgi:hypothetical protein
MAMLTEAEIRAAIARLAKPIADHGRPYYQDPAPPLMDGLAWALLGSVPPHGTFRDMRDLHQFLAACGIPCALDEKGPHAAIRWDDAWMKAHGVTAD